MGLKENGELVAAATFREHQSPRFLEVVAFATHKLHHRQGKGRLLAALLNEWAQSQVLILMFVTRVMPPSYACAGMRHWKE